MLLALESIVPAFTQEECKSMITKQSVIQVQDLPKQEAIGEEPNQKADISLQTDFAALGKHEEERLQELL